MVTVFFNYVFIFTEFVIKLSFFLRPASYQLQFRYSLSMPSA
nr:MAG TPA: hypothetical protein [Caudoviricetes sp.]